MKILLGEDKITHLQNRLSQERSLFRSSSSQSDTAVCASFMVSEILAKEVKLVVTGK
jgi:hypothetical protein